LGIWRITSAALSSRCSTCARVHSAMDLLLLPGAVELVAELANQLLLGPGEAVVFGADDEHLLVAPAIALHPLRIRPVATKPSGRASHGRASASSSTTAPMTEAGLRSPSRPMLLARSCGSTPCCR